jgi:hypothetical protein
MKTVYKIESEWDLGLDDVYQTHDEALKDAKQAVKDLDILDTDDTFEELVEDGLIVIKKLKVE